MATDFQWLLAMHRTASRFGDGLKPELEALLRRDMARFGPEVQDMNLIPISSGPAHQHATKGQLAEEGIPSIAPGTPVREAWDQQRAGEDRCAALARILSEAPRKHRE